jgi:hypothetical protein
VIERLPKDYYPCFLGNGLDAVLIGPTGAMTSEAINGPDRCYWYKSDCYYGDERPALPVPHRWYRKEVEKTPRAIGSWYELAPLGRVWYELRLGGAPLGVTSVWQSFDPRTASLETTLDFGGLTARLTTFLHARLPLLAIRLRCSQEMTASFWAGGGPWIPTAEDADPFTAYTVEAGPVQVARYHIGALAGRHLLWLAAPPDSYGVDGREVWLARTDRDFICYFSVADDRDAVDVDAVRAEVSSIGFDDLLAEHQTIWKTRAGESSLDVPNASIQRFYDFSQYYFRAIQNPVSGGIPVGNLRQTWSSHVFWDSFFVARAILEANRLGCARAHCGFFERTIEHAREHAASDFQAAGLKWDWELTHRGQPAYGEDWIHVKEQVHNNAAYSNILWDYWRFTRDRTALTDLYPLLKGIATFFLGAIVVESEGSYELRPLVGVRESAVKVPYDTLTVAGTIRLLRNAAGAARALGRDEPFAFRCERVAQGLVPLAERLYNGQFFPTHAATDEMSLGSLAPAYPMEVLTANDPRIVSTARAYRSHATDLFTRSGDVHSPWVAGVLATTCARFGDGDTAWELLRKSEPALNVHGGCAEFVSDEGRWNIQYFSTAHGALCSALHNLVLQSRGDELVVCPSLPGGWGACHFRDLRADGFLVTCDLDYRDRRARVTLKNDTTETQTRTLRLGNEATTVTLQPGETVEQSRRVAPGVLQRSPVS